MPFKVFSAEKYDPPHFGTNLLFLTTCIQVWMASVLSMVYTYMYTINHICKQINRIIKDLLPTISTLNTQKCAAKTLPESSIPNSVQF